ncbi:polyprenyl synthetase family protein [Ignatzschineria sp. RMDPL8A]|uniref:polyprenyl synthetase family protein n=1 Tax=Ignatzschineria sp. RMDPL8A TaxID=2999236 RepID=UPI0024466965|nr:farnesyl diphosphate synthase [Ignatzschineria sp. RMDPL8A]MDG9728862.1 polyprenyl synthetase family protein [Ignatzschineria sp. RMDPL8A]
MTLLTPWLNEQLAAFEVEFDRYLASIDAPKNLKEAMRYSALNGGKRLRPMLLIAAGHLSGADAKILYPLGMAIEMIHAYSLIHDDLPAMDDDSLRRGKPTCHIQFDEATAILAGDALLTESFVILSHLEGISDSAKIKLIQLFSHSAGASGMVGGQMMDLEGEERKITSDELVAIHRLKTGKLIKASILAGAIAGNADEKTLMHLTEFADNIGLAFQVKDDILDVTGTSEELGKTAGKDLEQEKSTYVTLLGLEKATTILDELIDKAFANLNALGEKNAPLLNLTAYVVKRNY